MRTHTYRAACFWRGSTDSGYEDYSREHEAFTLPATERVLLSAEPAFLGDPTRLNPEQLLLIAASSCQLLSFLAVAARARLNVTEYRDEAEGRMSDDETPVRLSRVILRPQISVGGKIDEAAVLRLVRLAHRECYIANSLRSSIEIYPDVEIVPTPWDPSQAQIDS